MKCRASVTFEFPTRQPDTLSIAEIKAVGMQTIASRAVTEARKALKPVGWSSLVVLLERLDEQPSASADEEGAGDVE